MLILETVLVGLTIIAILGFLFYYIVIAGRIWGILLFTLLPWLGSVALKSYFPSTAHTCITITPFTDSYSISWAFVICFALIGVGVGYFTSKAEE